MIKFKRSYLLIAIIIFILELLIALFMHDRIIRPYVGDFLVVILIYCFIKAFLNLPVSTTAVAVLLFSYSVETLQYFKIVNKLGLQDSNLAKIVIGTSFAWTDILAYTLGIIFVLFIEKIIANKKAVTSQ